MGKRERSRKAKIIEEKNKKKEYLESIRKEKYSWLTPWKRADFWVYAVSAILILAFPFLMKDKLIYGDQAIIHTSKGDIEIEFYRESAPRAVENFQKLTEKNYFNNTTWHRVIKGFMIQGGDPEGTGMGGESAFGGSFEDEINPESLGMTEDQTQPLEEKGYVYNYDLQSHKVEVGSVAMANSGPNTNGSQFFIVTEEDQLHLNGQHTVFARVTKGLDIAKAISEVAVDEQDKPLEPVYIISIEIR